jgi:HEAT repeat protein
MLFWFWGDVYLATSVTQFWIVVNDIFHPRQARRVVGFFISGGLLGGIAGSLLARLATIIATENLLLIAPIFILLSLGIIDSLERFLPREREQERAIAAGGEKAGVSLGKSFELVRKSRYLLLLAGIMTSAICVTTLVDFQFNSFLDITFGQNRDARTSFLGTFFAGLLIFSYFLHVLFTNRILRSFGIRVALLVAPIFLMLGAVSIFFVPASHLMAWAVIVRGGDKSLTHTLSQSVRELLYIPISPEVKYRAKVFIDMFVNKFADGLAASLLIISLKALHLSVKLISLIALAIILAWVLLSRQIMREYVNIVKRNLKLKWADADKLVMEKLDIDATKLVFDTLQSKQRSSVLYAMNLFDLVKKEKLSPELRRVIAGKSVEVQAASLDSLLDLDGEALFPEVDDSLEEESLDVQVKEVMSLNVYQELMKGHFERVSGERRGESEVTRMEMAKALGLMARNSPLVSRLQKLLRDESPEVLSYAIESAGKLRIRQFVPLLVKHLAKPSLQNEAGRALAEYGDRISGTLRDYLSDREEDIRVRRAIPVILARIGSQRAANVLVQGLGGEYQDVEPQVIESLHRMRADHPGLRFREDMVLPAIFIAIKGCYLSLQDILEHRTGKKEAPPQQLEGSLSLGLRRIFELLGLIYPPEDVEKAYQNICAGTKKSVDYSLELLDNILKKEIKVLLFPLIEDLPDEDRLRACRKILQSFRSKSEGII